MRNVHIKKASKIPAFSENLDTMDSYLQRFERFATANNWNREEWAVSLSASLTGKALDVYSRLSDENTTNYDELKNALLKIYNLTEHGYREKFRKCRPEKEESPEQYIFRMETYLEKWIELSNSQTYEGLRDLIIKEQVIEACPKDLGIHLMERAPNDLKELAKLSDQYMKAHGKQLYREFKNALDDSKTEKFVCTDCKKTGHKIQDCRWLKNEKTKDKPRCFSCGKESHFQRDCRVKKIKSAVSVENEPDGKDPEEYSACCMIHSDAQRNLTKFDKIKECIRGDQLMLKNGESVDIITNACQEKTRPKTMPVMQGRIGDQTVTTL